ESLRAQQPKTYAVVAKIAIPARTIILDEQVDIIKIQDEAIPTTAAVARPPRLGEEPSDSDKQRTKTQVIGQVAGLNIPKREIISLEHIGKQATAVAPALDIPMATAWYQVL